LLLMMMMSLSCLTIGCQSRAAMPIDDRLCQQYARLKNAGDPAADDLLAAAPDANAKVVDAEDKDAFDAAWVLRAPCKVLDVRHDHSKPGTARFVLVLHGGATTPEVAVAKAGSIGRPSQRTLMNPDVLVEVREGKIVPIKVGLHRE
jgi:hypothetical protein